MNSDSTWQPFYLNSIPNIEDKYHRKCLELNDIISEDENNKITSVLIFNFMVELDYLLDENFQFFTTKNILILHGQKDLTYDKRIFQNLTMSVVDLGNETYGTHHTKMFIIFYEHGIRISISTSNLIRSDYEMKTQAIFVQDFPLKTFESSRSNLTSMTSGCSGNTVHEVEGNSDSFFDPKQSTTELNKSNTTTFENDLIDYLNQVNPKNSTAQSKYRKIVDLIHHYDFSSAEVILIPSVPGRHRINSYALSNTHYVNQKKNPFQRKEINLNDSLEMPRYGHMKLRYVLERYYKRRGALQTMDTNRAYDQTDRKVLSMQFSSLGSMGRNDFLFYEVTESMGIRFIEAPSSTHLSNFKANTINLETQLRKRKVGESANSIDRFGNRMGNEAKRADDKGVVSIQLIWPTVNDVRLSFEGYTAGGSLCCDSKHILENPDIPKKSQLKNVFMSKLRVWDARVSGRQRAAPHIKSYCVYRKNYHCSTVPGMKMGSHASSTIGIESKSLICIDCAEEDDEVLIVGDTTFDAMNVVVDFDRPVSEMSAKRTRVDFGFSEVNDKEVRRSEENSPEAYDIELDWFLLTSANFSQAAWGILQNNQTTLYIKSFELGVLFLPDKVKTRYRVFSCTPNHPKLGYTATTETQTSTSKYARFLVQQSESSGYSESYCTAEPIIYFPIPYNLDCRAYSEQYDEPWIWNIPHREPDINHQRYNGFDR